MGNRLREISIRLIRPAGLRQGEGEQNKDGGGANGEEGSLFCQKREVNWTIGN